MGNKEIKEFANGYAEALISMGKLTLSEKGSFINGFVEGYKISKGNI